MEAVVFVALLYLAYRLAVRKPSRGVQAVAHTVETTRRRSTVSPASGQLTLADSVAFAPDNDVDDDDDPCVSCTSGDCDDCEHNDDE